MKDLIWDNSLSVQIQEIDDDHRKLVDLCNMLTHAVEKGESTAYIDAVMDELVSCTVWHFRHEERLMLEHGYDELPAHKSEHQELIESAQQLQDKFRDSDTPLSSDDIEFLEHWLTGHILGADMELGSYLNTVM